MRTSAAAWSGRQKVGFVLAILLALPNFIFTPTPDGEVGPPTSILIADAVLAAVVIAAIAFAWVRGSFVAARLGVAALVLITLSALPALFVGVPAWVKLLVSAVVVVNLIVAALILTPARRATTSPTQAP